MCGRFTIVIRPDELQLELDLGLVPSSLDPHKDYFPGSGIPVIIDAQSRNVEIFYWGLVPSWAKDVTIGRKMFNAKAETLIEKPSYKTAFLRSRCLIPATGYYEWKFSGKGKISYLFSSSEEKAFTFAGLWEYWMDSTGNEVYSATIITCPANEITGQYHDRMPVILGRDDRWKWMEDRPINELQQLLVPYDPKKMEIVQVAK